MNHKAFAVLAALLLSLVHLTRARDINPVLLSTFSSPAGATTTDVAVSGNLVYVCAGEKGLTILQISNSSFLQYLGSVDTPGFASAIALTRNLALVADATHGLEIIDVSIPSAPSIIGSFDTLGTATSVVTADNLAFVADSSYGLQIIDFSIPSQPVRVGGYNTFGTALSVAVSGNYAYIADANNGLVVIDVAIPAAAHRVGGYDRLPATHITISGNYAYVSGPGPLITFDISNPLDPQPISSLDLPGNVTASTVSGNTTYVASDIGGFHVLDTADPFAPKVLGSSSVISNATRVAASGPLAFVADLTNGVRVFAGSNPAVMDVVAHIPIAGYISDLVVSGDYLYMVDGQSRTNPFFRIVNISKANDMRITGVFGPLSDSRVEVFDTYAFTFGNSGNIISVADPANPTRLPLPIVAGARDAKGVGPYLFRTIGAGVYIETMSGAAGLQRVGTFSRTPGQQMWETSLVTVQGTNAWAFTYWYLDSGGFTGPFVVGLDISDVSKPVFSNSSASLGSDPLKDSAARMAASDTNLVVFFRALPPRSSQIRIFNSRSLVDVAARSVPNAIQFAVAKDIIYLAKASQGLEVLRLDGTTLNSVGGAGLPNATAITVTTNYVFVGAGTNGLYVLTHYQPTARLEASINTNGMPQLRVLAPIGSAGRIQRASTLTTNSFQDWQFIQQTSYPQTLTDTNSPSAFYRFVSP